MQEWLWLTWCTVVYGIVEGITEFLPISSTGHLILFQQFMGERSEMFNITIQSGAIAAVVVIYWKRLVDLVLRWREPQNFDYLIKTFTAVAVTVVLALGCRAAGMRLPENLAPVAWAVFLGALVIFAAEYHLRGRKGSESITWTLAIVVGIAQVIAAIFPGTSRSAATIIAAMFCGAGRPAATEFSFLVGIPTMLAATVYSIADHWMEHGSISGELDQLAIGFIVSAIVAFIVVRWLIQYVRSNTFIPFAWYRLVLGLVLLGWVSLSAAGA